MSLERQLQLESTMDGCEDVTMQRVVADGLGHPEGRTWHPSNMPAWNRREWVDDPFYGWRTQPRPPRPLGSNVPAAQRLAAANAAAPEASNTRPSLPGNIANSSVAVDSQGLDPRTA